MNAASQLKVLLQQDSFVKTSNFPQSFITLLIGLCDHITIQSHETDLMKSQLAEFASKSEVEEVKSRSINVKKEIDNQIASLKAGMEMKYQDVRAISTTQFGELKSRLTNAAKDNELSMKSTLNSVKQDLQSHETQITNLLSQIEKAAANIKNTNLTITQLRDTIPPSQESSINNLGKRLEKLEQTTRGQSLDIKGADTRIEEFIQKQEIKHQKLTESMQNALLELEAKSKAMPTTYANEDDQPKIINGDIDISPLIRGIFRDSRRLDALNELISITRLESNDIVESMLELQKNMQQFNHNTHDLAIEDGRIKALLVERANFFQMSIMNLERQIGDIWSYMHQVADSVDHAASNVSNTFDQTQTILQSMITRPIPLIGDMSNVQMETRALSENIAERRTQFEGDREKYRNLPADRSPSAGIRPINVQKFKRRTAPIPEIELPYDDYKKNPRSAESGTDGIKDSFVIRSIEELRVKMNEIMADGVDLHSNFEDLINETTKKISGKVDNGTMERMLKKVYDIIEKLSKRMDSYENTSELLMIQIADAKARPVKNPNESEIKVSRRESNVTNIPRDKMGYRIQNAQSSSRSLSTAMLFQGSALKMPSSSRASVTGKSRLASSNISNNIE